MAKRQGKARTRKAARKTTGKASRKASRTVRKAVKRKAARVRVSRPSPRRSGKAAPRGKAVARKKAASRKKAAPRRTAQARKAAPKAPAKRATILRPKPAALSRERRQLRDDETSLSAPSTLGYAAKASSAESGHQMYRQRQKEHTEGGSTLTGGDVDTDWNDAYSSGEEAPGGDMSTPDQDVVEEIGRALGVEYQDAEELKGAEKIEDRDRHRWEYDPASAEDYTDRNRRDED
jgi:hypothetical protein